MCVSSWTKGVNNSAHDVLRRGGRKAPTDRFRCIGNFPCKNVDARACFASFGPLPIVANQFGDPLDVSFLSKSFHTPKDKHHFANTPSLDYLKKIAHSDEKWWSILIKNSVSPLHWVRRLSEIIPNNFFAYSLMNQQ